MVGNPGVKIQPLIPISLTPMATDTQHMNKRTSELKRCGLTARLSFYLVPS